MYPYGNSGRQRVKIMIDSLQTYSWLSVSVGTSQRQHQRQSGPPKTLFCYYSSTSQLRAGNARFTPELIDVRLCTHVIFAFADVVEGKYVRPHNWNDLRNGHDMGTFTDANGVRHRCRIQKHRETTYTRVVVCVCSTVVNKPASLKWNLVPR